MRDLFPGHYSPSPEDFTEMWTNGIFVFDTNVLLDLYRYSETTVNSLLELMEKVADRIWLPYQVSKEYHKNLNGVISDQVRKYENSIKTLVDFRKQIDEKRSHPFLSEELTKEITLFCEKFDKELGEKKKAVKNLILGNPVKEKLADLTHGKVGSQFEQIELEAIYKEGETRYKIKIPPGFGDLSKPIPDRYGDLIFWKEILRKNSEIDRPIILITGDKKEDWYLKELGLTIGPKPELIEEFKKTKRNLFYVYPTDQFLKYSKQYLQMDITDETIKEVGEYIQEYSKPEANEETQSSINHYDTSNIVDPFLMNEDDYTTTDQTEEIAGTGENEVI